MTGGGLFFAIECVLVPCAIGFLMYVAFGVWDKRRRRGNKDAGLPPVNYNI